MSIINTIPAVLIYILPGYVGIKFFTSVSRVKMTEHGTILGSCTYSYVVLTLLKLICQSADIHVLALLSVLTCFALACMAAKALQNKKLSRLLADTIRYSPFPGPWESVYDYERGTRIRLYVTDKDNNENDFIVVGDIEAFGNVPSNPWIAIANYSLFASLKDNEPYYTQKDGTHHMMINLEKVTWVELWDDLRPIE